MSATHVALIRGINVGKAKRVSMADLKAAVEGLGYRDVRTLLNSGNVVFTARSKSAAAAGRIEKALVDHTGVSARVTVLTADELAAAIAGNPLLPVADPTRLLLAVFNSAADRSRAQPLLKEDWSPEQLGVGPRVAYLWCPEGVLASRLPEAVSRELRDAVTMRNWATMLKLHALVTGTEPTGKAPKRPR
jgi:uncharacterized protein (DUF1697 family)